MSLKIGKVLMQEEDRKLEGRSFLRRKSTWIVAGIGFVAAHIVWYRIVEANVAEENKPKIFIYRLMQKLDPFKKEELKK